MVDSEAIYVAVACFRLEAGAGNLASITDGNEFFLLAILADRRSPEGPVKRSG